MSPTLQKILNALEKSDSIPAKEKERLRKELEKTEKTLQEKDTQLSAQARELEIETSLERIRARAMAMQQSEDLSDVLAVLFQQFDVLGIHPVNVWLSLYNKEEGTFTYRATGTSGKRIHKHQVIDLNAMDIWKESVEQWENGTADEVIVTHYPLDIFPQLMEVFKETFMAMPEEERIHPKDFPDGGYNVQGYCKFGYIGFNHKIPPTDEEKDILKKFATEFERMYQRFLEIQKAEAQTREAQIETALERIRARAMAMQSSEELHDVLCVLFQQFDVLGIKPISAFLSLFSSEERVLTYRATGTSGARTQGSQTVEIDSLEVWKELYDKWKTDTSEDVEVIFYPKEVFPTLFGLFEETFASMPPDERMTPDHFPEGGYTMHGHTRFGYIGYNHTRLPTEEEKEILTKFATEFERVYQRFLDIENAEAQARQAQIEAALERVRTRTMAMNNTDDIAATVTTFFNEIMGLGLGDSTRSGIGILSQSEKMELWTASVDKKSEVVLHKGLLDMTIHPLLQGVKKAWQTGEPHFTYELSGEDKMIYFRAINKAPEYPMKIDLKKLPETIYHYSFPFRDGSLFVFSDEHLRDDIQEIFKRFAAVFGQTYTRYLDLRKAEAQAWEAQVEAALERVRARSMAMHKTEELQDVINTVYRQFLQLHIEITGGAFIAINSEIDSELICWGAGGTANYIEKVHLPFMDMPIYTELVERIKMGPGFFTESFSQEEKQLFFKELFRISPYNKAAEGRKKEVLSRPGGYTRSCVVSPYTSIFIINHHGRPFSAEENDILMRMGKVFEQTYTRFLDLQKAEEQAREAEIQLSIERIRAKTLAMQESTELTEVLSVIFQQLKLLGVETIWTHLTLVHLEENAFTYRMTGRNGERIIAEEKISLDASEHWKHISDAVKSADKDPDPITRFEVPVEGLDAIWRLFDGIFSKLPEGQKVSPSDFPNGLYTTQAYCKFGFLGLNYTREATEEEADILLRFTTEFSSLYQRFLDLKQAETRAREAQIEAALERIRARSMAMHSSEELNDVLRVMFQQIEVLGIDAKCAHLTLMDLENNTFSFRITGKNGAANIGEQIIELNAMPIWKETVAKWKKAKPHSHQCLVYAPEILPDLWKLIDTSLKSLPAKERIKISDFPKGLFDCEGHNKFGYIGFNNSRPPSDEEISIAIRFAREFERVYQRFLEIKKAEAQTREAQIEAAIEKVRSQSLAMHTTSEMQQVANAVFDQLQNLGLEMDAVGMSGVIEANQDYDVWVGGAPFGKALRIPYNEDSKVQRDYNKAIKLRHELFAKTYSGKVKEEYINHLLTHGEFPKALKKKMVTSTAFSTSIAFAKNSGIQIARYTNKPYTAEENELLKRFARVFEQAYIRFMDLQKAESQAREAQIEAALERVRAASMAMHQTGDIAAVVVVFFDQLRQLNIPFEQAWINIFQLEEGYLDTWFSPIDGIYPEPTHFKMPSGPWEETAIKSWKSGVPFAYLSLETKVEVDQFLEACDEITDSKYFTHIQKKRRYHRLEFLEARHKYGFISKTSKEKPTKEDEEILERFAKVFEQTYTRFLDIEKAEAQARESQIEAALEKVRSRSLAMQKPEELQDVVAVVAEELKKLGVVLDVGGVVLCTYFTDSKDVIHWTASDDPKHPSVPFFLPYFEDTLFDEAWASKLSGERYFAKDFSYEVKNAWFEKAFEISDYRDLPEDYKKQLLSSESHGIAFAWAENSAIMVPSLEGNLPSATEKEILMRFAKVFEQAYIRFMDLEKAEAQARESKIEIALERVRSRAMAMHHTDELTDVLGVLFDQFDFLGINPVLTHLTLFDEENETFTLRITTGGEKRTIAEQLIDVNAVESWKTSFANWKKSELHAVDCIDYPPEVLPAVWEVLDGVMSALPEGQKIFPEDFPNGLYTTQGHCKYGYIGFNHSRRATEEEKEIVIRFAKEFGRLYQRFLDIQKAEAQAREAQIEAALEKVRSASLAMHQSKDLHNVLVMLYNQLAALGLKMHSAQIIESIDDFKEMHTWIVTNGVVYPEQVHAPFSKNIFFKRFREAVTNGESFYTLKFSKRQKDNLFHHFFDNTILRNAPQARKDLIFSSPGIGTSNAIGKFTSLSIMRYDGILYSEEENEIIKRFLKVFEQSYTRFLDLQKAESQAREAQIEAALERVRSKAMAMHSSDDLADTVEILYKELDTLQVHALRFGHAKVNSDTKIVELHTATDLGKVVGQLKLEGHPLLEKIYEHYLAKEDLYYALQGEEMKSYYSILGRAIDVPIPPMDTVQHGYFFFLGDTANYAWSDKALDEEELKVYRRLITVLNLTYKRYEELKNAETQAREAQIEGALERVRSRTMAMHNSEELEEIVLSLFDEVLKLGIDKSIRCGIGILEGHEGMETRSVNSNSDGTVDLKVGMLNMTIHPMLVGLKKAWKNGSKSYSYDYSSKDVRKYYTALNNEPEYPFNADLTSLPNQEYHRSFFFSSGIIFAFSENPISEESSKILARFAAVFGQTYQRFLDLQKAEERAKDAVKQASLDRVRGQIASMRSVNDLERITPLVWNELTILGIPFIRCGVFIIEESSKMVQAFLSAPDGRSLGAMKIPFDTEKNTAETVAHWQKGEVYRTHWDKKQFLQFMQNMIDLGQVNNNKKYQGAEEPPESLHLHFVPFTQGMLYVGSEATLAEEQIELVQSLADAFAIAYARYEDFSKLEKAKERVETTLSELKATQNQLVQSEKMASLGELTAGIAHEIQNPLNFVNNFSEVSIELIEEMLEEIQKGDVEEVKALAEDIIQNLEKINHHGKRADGIVKGMLQHSRASSGEKEPTDLNVLADEYLRLAYHGLRAKDKSFNATLETHFDESIGKVNLMTQDMGRVILNLITNAFYVVKEKKEQQPHGYEPTVTVTTRKVGNKVQIAVKDNGNGIPHTIKEKIFQPFFTTKPTGQGTGLGLSMSYDIITKGHGGELDVSTKEGEGSEFTISIPLNQKL